jgi:hypothetical protein
VALDRFLFWLAASPLGSAFKVGLSASLVWVVENVGSLSLEPVVQIALTAALPVLINWLNPQDWRYGK